MRTEWPRLVLRRGREGNARHVGVVGVELEFPPALRKEPGAVAGRTLDLHAHGI